MPGSSFLSEIQEWSGYGRIIWHEVAVITGETQESSYIGGCLGYWPVCYSLEFLQAHLEVVFPYNDFEIFNLFFFELTFLWFEIEIVFFELG